MLIVAFVGLLRIIEHLLVHLLTHVRVRIHVVSIGHVHHHAIHIVEVAHLLREVGHIYILLLVCTPVNICWLLELLHIHVWLRHTWVVHEILVHVVVHVCTLHVHVVHHELLVPLVGVHQLSNLVWR